MRSEYISVKKCVIVWKIILFMGSPDRVIFYGFGVYVRGYKTYF